MISASIAVFSCYHLSKYFQVSNSSNKFWQQLHIRNNCESVLNKDIEGYHGYLRVVAFGLSLVSPDTMTLLKAPGIVKTAHGNPLGDVARQTPSLLCKALHIRELSNPVKQTRLYRIICCIYHKLQQKIQTRVNKCLSYLWVSLRFWGLKNLMANYCLL